MTENKNIIGIEKILKPIDVKREFSINYEISKNVIKWRNQISDILSGKDKRLLVIVGPCSIHDEKLAIEYAQKLKLLSDLYSDRLMIVMRVYFEKPRTTIGWRGLINDPNLDNSCRINDGIRIARDILLKINKIGLPVGCEFLDVFLPQYYADLVSWGAIGARTTESQQHRQLASGLSMPIGFKNGTGGSIDIAADALISASNSHVFLGIDTNGIASRISTTGNKSVHIILRGSKNEPNYYPENIEETYHILESKGLSKKIMIDLSHGNSKKVYTNQPIVGKSVCEQIKNGNDGIIGVMIESNIKEGKQKLISKKDLLWGISITDGCINLDTTNKLLNEFYNSVFVRFK